VKGRDEPAVVAGNKGHVAAVPGNLPDLMKGPPGNGLESPAMFHNACGGVEANHARDPKQGPIGPPTPWAIPRWATVLGVHEELSRPAKRPDNASRSPACTPT
jgi:hypothetical protein